MFSLIIPLFIIAFICIFAAIYSKARKVKQKHIDEAEKRGDVREVERLKNMSDDEAADEFEDELNK